MSAPIIVGIALRDDDEAPLALARVLARLTCAPLALVTTYPYGQSPLIATAEWIMAMREQAKSAVIEIAAGLSEEFPVSVHVRDEASVAGALQDAAQELDAAAIVVGSSHHGPIGRVLAGDVATSLLHGAPCPVAVAPRGYEPPPDCMADIGVAFVDTPESRAALTTAAALTRRCRGTLSVYTVYEPIGWAPAHIEPGWSMPQAYEDERRRQTEATSKLAESLIPYGIRASCGVLTGSPALALGDASRHLDLLVCGSRGYGGLRAIALGAVSRGLTRSAACPLLIVPRTSAKTFAQPSRGLDAQVAA